MGACDQTSEKYTILSLYVTKPTAILCALRVYWGARVSRLLGQQGTLRAGEQILVDAIPLAFAPERTNHESCELRRLCKP